jgi:probable F420-dependent oxidoreductase
VARTAEGRHVKFGIMFANVGPYAHPDGAVALARTAEDLGFESLWTVEHTVVPTGYLSEYPYSPTGRMPGDERSEIPDPLIWLSYVAAVTTRLRLATGILILPQRNPVTLAKELATLDVLSSGRMELGIGVGWLREEFEALGAPFDDRAERTDDFVAALRTLWAPGPDTYQGRFVEFTEANCYPKPSQQGGIPVVVGGHTAPAARRAGRLGDGFFPGVPQPDAVPPLLEVMRAAARDTGRDPDAIEVTAGGAFDHDGAARLADAGVDRLVIPPLTFNLEKLRSRLGQFADEVVSKLG